jgi:excisionase family DNA binding protein
MPEILTINQVAEYLQVSRNAIYRLLAQKKLPGFKVGNQWRFHRKMIDAWLITNSEIQTGTHTNKISVSRPQTADESINTDQVKVKKALIVDDHPDLLFILTCFMESLGYHVVSATHGREGVEKAAKEKPHIILMDILMPGMDGREATRRIRSNPKTQNIPILASTVLNNQSDIKTCIEAGCNDFLVKPFTRKQLQGKLQEYISTSNTTIH